MTFVFCVVMYFDQDIYYMAQSGTASEGQSGLRSQRGQVLLALCPKVEAVAGYCSGAEAFKVVSSFMNLSQRCKVSSVFKGWCVSGSDPLLAFPVRQGDLVTQADRAKTTLPDVPLATKTITCCCFLL